MELLQGELKDIPKDEIVLRLADVGTIENLTELKIALVVEARNTISEFPKGEPYIRRKPKGRSALNTLEQRLAVDIAELFSSLDTGVVTPEIKAMFKATGETCRSGNNDRSSTTNADLPVLNSQDEEENNNIAVVHDSCREHFANMATDFLLFKESVKGDISKLEKQLNEQGKLISIQDKQISDLLRLNSNLHSHFKEIRRHSTNNLCLGSLNNRTAVSHGLLTPQGRRNTIESINQSLDLREEVSSSHPSILCEPRNTRKQVVNVSKHQTPVYEIVEENPCGQEKHLSMSDKMPLKKNADHVAKKQDQSTKEVLYSEKVKQSSELHASFHQEQNTSVSCIQLSSTRFPEKPVDQQEQSEQQHEQPHEHQDVHESPFVGVERKRRKVKRFFLSGIAENVTVDQIYDFLKRRNIIPTHLKTFISKRKGTIGAKLNVLYSDSSNILDAGFWPKYVSCKPWLTKSRLEKVNQLKKFGNIPSKQVLS